MKKLVLAALAASTTIVGAPVLAAPIIYTGSQQVGSINASYTLTTDGTLGDIRYYNFTNYSLTLSDPQSSVTVTGNNSDINATDIVATLATLSLNLDFPLNTQFVINHPALAGGFDQLILTPETSQAFIDDNAGYRGSSGLGAVTFATAVPVMSAVPEPATWTTMIVGFGAVGFAMRRRQKVRTTVRFA